MLTIIKANGRCAAVCFFDGPALTGALQQITSENYFGKLLRKITVAQLPEEPLSPEIQPAFDDDISFAQLVHAQLIAQVGEKQLNAIAPISLAYIGDAVFELYVRSRLLIPAKRSRDYHQQVVSQVKAEQQSLFVDVLIPHLSDVEKEILRRGRNATTGRNRRAKGAAYQKATGLEALIGFLYLSDADRLLSLLNLLEIGT